MAQAFDQRKLKPSLAGNEDDAREAILLFKEWQQPLLLAPDDHVGFSKGLSHVDGGDADDGAADCGLAASHRIDAGEHEAGVSVGDECPAAPAARERQAVAPVEVEAFRYERQFHRTTSYLLAAE